MSMFCYQCQEAAKNEGCTVRGVCGKNDTVSNLQDLLIYTLKGISQLVLKAEEAGVSVPSTDHFIMNGLFVTITNANFDDAAIVQTIKDGLELRDSIKATLTENGVSLDGLHDAAQWTCATEAELLAK